MAVYSNPRYAVMSAVIPKDLTGLVRHPTKMDCWIPGQRSSGENLCKEIPIGPTMQCTLGVPNLSALTHNHLTQIQMELWNNRGGGPEGKIINAFYSGATPNQLMSHKEVQDHTDALIHYLGDAKKASDYIDRELEFWLTERPHEMPPKKSTMEVYDEISLDWKTQIYNHVVRQFGGKQSSYLQGVNKDTLLPALAVEEFAKVVIAEYDDDPRLAADVLKAAMTEHITLMSAMAMNEAMKEKGLMGQITKVTDNMIEQVNTKGEENEALKQLIERGPEGYAPNPTDYVSNCSTVPIKTEPTPAEEQFVNPKYVKFDSKGNVIKKRMKSKAKSNHIPNMKSRHVKSTLGALILGKLGKVQRDTQDAHKRALLKELPAADVIEMATGEKLPDYQANLINAMHAKSDPEAPIVKRMTSAEYEVKLDTALAEHISPDMLPEGMTGEQTTEVLADTKTLFMEQFNKCDVGTATVTVDQVGVSIDGKIYDVSIVVDGTDKYFLHYEKFTDLAAVELEMGIKYVQDRIDAELWAGLKQTILDFLPVQYAKWKEKFTTDEILELIYKLVVGYTVGSIQAFIHKEHSDRKAAEVAKAADLG